MTESNEQSDVDDGGNIDDYAALRAAVNGMLARSGSTRGMLQGCAEALVQHIHVAFARIWTLRSSQSVLELQASAGLYTRLDGTYARVPVSERKIGLIVREGQAHLTNNVLDDALIADKDWVRREGLVAFAGYPLIVDSRVVGVMAMFSKHTMGAGARETLASIAAAVAQGMERKRSEEQLQRSEAYLAEGQRLSHTGSWAWNLRTNEMFWSAEMYRIYGFDPANGPPTYQQVLALAHPDDVAAVRHALEGEPSLRADFRLTTRIRIRDEPQKYIETVGHAVRDQEGNVDEFIGTVIDITARRRSNRRLRRAIKARYEAVLAERTRIARDMHDGLLQNINGIALQLGALLPHVHAHPDSVAGQLEHIIALAERTSREARQAVIAIREKAGSADLVSAVQSEAERVLASSALALSVGVSGGERGVSSLVREVAISIVHEALTNVLRHAHANGVEVFIAFRRKTIGVSVTDDGRGLTVAEAPRVEHFGILGMRERAASVGGVLRISSAPGRGTKIRLDVPVSV